jgi:hypothetical protein
MGKQNIAYQLLCADKNVRETRRISGDPCIEDQQHPAMTSAPTPVAMAPMPTTPNQVVAATPPAIVPTPLPAWCAKATPSTVASELYYKQQCRAG